LSSFRRTDGTHGSRHRAASSSFRFREDDKLLRERKQYLEPTLVHIMSTYNAPTFTESEVIPL
jgi:hypothetical protein